MSFHTGWVTLGHSAMSGSMSGLPESGPQRLITACRMSAKTGHEQMQQIRPQSALFDHLVGTLLQKPRQIQLEFLRGGDIDDQQVFGSQFYREVGRFTAFEDFVDVGGDPPVHLLVIHAVGHEPPICMNAPVG